MELRKRNRSKENISKKAEEKFFIDKIFSLLNQLKVTDYSISDLPLIIINYFSKKGFTPLTINDITKYISNKAVFPSFSKNNNLREDIISELKNNNIFEIKKKKYELNLEKCFNYLSSYQENNFLSGNINFDDKNQKIKASIVTFPLDENEVVYFSSKKNNKLKKNFNLEENNIDQNNLDNSFTFGERTQEKYPKKKKSKTIHIKEDNKEIKINKNTNNNINIGELENKALEKYIPEFTYIFDENKNLEKLTKAASDFYTVYKRINMNKKNIKKLDENIKKMNSIIDEINAKIEPFNKLSSCFNEEKNELFNVNSVIHQQLKLMQIIAESDFLSKKIYTNEKELYISFQNLFKNLLNKLQEDFNEVKNMEKIINSLIIDLKNVLNGISDEFVLKLNDNYTEFYNLIKDINNNKITPINVNMNDTLKLFNSYYNDFEKLLSKLEENVIQKKEKNSA